MQDPIHYRLPIYRILQRSYFVHFSVSLCRRRSLCCGRVHIHWSRLLLVIFHHGEISDFATEVWVSDDGKDFGLQTLVTNMLAYGGKTMEDPNLQN